MMQLRDGAGREILLLQQCLTPLEKNLKFEVASCNFQETQGFSCNLMGCSVLFVNSSPV
jgi:hypothetical protein